MSSRAPQPAAPAPLGGIGVVAVFAHPDDEAYSAAATLAHCARLGARVDVVCLSRGESGRARHATGIRGAELAEIRCAELAASCRVIGAEPPVILDLPDGGLSRLASAAVAKCLASVLEPLDPALLITHGRDGAYGHPDHLAVSRAVAEALPLLPPRAVRRLLHAEFPRGVFAPLWRALRRRPGLVEPGSGTAELGIDDDAAHYRLRLDPRLRRIKLAAIASHHSQLVDGDPRSFLLPGLVDALLDEEWFTVAAGPAVPGSADHPCAGLEACP